MEPFKISTLLNDSTALKFAARKVIEVNDLSGRQYSIMKNIRFETPMLRWDLCYYSDAYIIVKRAKNVRTVANTNVNPKDKK